MVSRARLDPTEEMSGPSGRMSEDDLLRRIKILER